MKVPKVLYIVALIAVCYILFLDITSGVSIYGMILPGAIALMLVDYI